jgi:replicative DNA helicase
MSKSKGPRTVYTCQSCGNQSPKWLGKCPDCGEWNSFVEERRAAGTPAAREAARGGMFRLNESRTQRYADIASQDDARQPSGIAEFDRVLGGGIVPGSLVLIGGEPGIGKCVTGDTRILDPDTGALRPIEEMLRERRPVVSLNTETFKLQSNAVSEVIDQGVQSVVEVATRLGRTLRCTASHPVLTPDGWTPVGDLSPGARIASPRSLAYFGRDSMPEHEVKLIAYVLSDGSAQSAITVTTALPEVEQDVREVARAFDMEVRVYAKPGNRAKTLRFVQPRPRRAHARREVSSALKAAQVHAAISWAEWGRRAGVSYASLNGMKRGRSMPRADELERLARAAGVATECLAPEARCRAEKKTPIARLLESLGLRYASAATKRVPEPIFRLPREQLATFLKTLFSCDGSVYVNNHDEPGVSYSTISDALARDVQHLLLRFGFVTRLRTKRSVVNERPYTAFELQLLGHHNVCRFLDEVGIFGRETAKARVAALPGPRLGSTRMDTVPTGFAFWSALAEATEGAPFMAISRRAGVRLLNRRHDRPLCRSTVAALAAAYPSPFLRACGEGDLYWDEIERIVPAGEERVFDLGVPPHSNFVANDLVVHNSTLMAQVASALSASVGSVLYVSGEESERQIKLRGERLGLAPEHLYLLPETCLERVFEHVEALGPEAIIVDSVQTVFSMKLESAPGSVSQVREVSGQFLVLAKNRTVPVFLIGHVTNEGSIAGPEVDRRVSGQPAQSASV